MNCLIQHGVVEEYVPLMDIKGSYSAQFEHVSLFHGQFGCNRCKTNTLTLDLPPP